jgi:hypothetical protein
MFAAPGPSPRQRGLLLKLAREYERVGRYRQLLFRQ